MEAIKRQACPLDEVVSVLRVVGPGRLWSDRCGGKEQIACQSAGGDPGHHWYLLLLLLAITDISWNREGETNLLDVSQPTRELAHVEVSGEASEISKGSMHLTAPPLLLESAWPSKYYREAGERRKSDLSLRFPFSVADAGRRSVFSTQTLPLRIQRSYSSNGTNYHLRP